MSFLRTVLSPFVDLETPPKRPGPIQRMDNPPPPPPKALTPEDVDKFTAHFDKLFHDANLPGPDYFEFSKAVDALTGAIPDPTTRMRAAFGTLQVQGLTKEQLLSTADQYIHVVDADRKAIEEAAAAKSREEIEPLELHVKNAATALADDEAKIRELQAGLEARRRAVQEAERHLEEARDRLGVNIASYQTACAAVVERIHADIANIKTLL